MVTIQNKKVTVGDKDMTYAELIKSCLNTIPERGFSVDEMAARLRIHSKINDKSVKFQFEDAEIDKIRECAKLTTNWALLSQSIIDFYKDLGIKQ